MFKIFSYYLLIKMRVICMKFNISTISKKTLCIFYVTSFILVTTMLAIFNYFIIQIILFYESNNMNIDLIMKTLYVIMIAYLSFHGISSTYSKVCAEKDNSFILKFRKQNKILVCKYFSEIFLKNIYISSMLYISINIAISVFVK